MKLRFLYTLGLLLCLSNFASPNECARHCPLAASSNGHAGSTAKPGSAAQAASTARAASPAVSSTAPAASASEPAAAVPTQTATGQGESNSPTLIKLLYI
jgi:hypothetical protein